MNPYKHSEISVKRWGGEIKDYYPLHKFIDCTKELCSDNRHRILHTHWAIIRIINPIFGDFLTNTDGKVVSIKDICEKDHVLPDYKNKFIPTLSDFVESLNEKEIKNWKEKIELLHKRYSGERKIESILLSPLKVTGQVKSLLFTHNSWFLTEILPRIYSVKIDILDFEIKPSEIFNAMNFELWMDNGAGYPKSANKIKHNKVL